VKVSVQLTSVATGEVKVVEVEASSEKDAITMFDAAKYDVSVVRSDEMERAQQDDIEKLRQRAEAIDKAIAQGLPLKLTILVMVAASLVGCGLSAYLTSQGKQGRSDRSGSQQGDAKSGLWLEVLRDRK